MRDAFKDLRNRVLNDGRNGARQWYSIKNLSDDEAELFIYDIIGESWFGGVTARQFVQDLQAIEASKILLRINSPGGDVNDGIAIRNALQRHPATIETHIDGAAYSTASWVGLAGEKVVMAKHATMMIHEPYSIVIGDSEQMRKEAEVLDIFAGEIAEMYAEKAGGERDEWRQQMKSETWFTGQTALDAGLVDEIAEGEAKAENTFDRAFLAAFKNVPPWAETGGRREPKDPAVKDDKAPAGEPTEPTYGDELIRERLQFEKFRTGQVATVGSGREA